MAPFDTTTIIPAGWSQHHQPVVVGAMNATVTITDPARTTPGEWNPYEQVYDPPTPHVVATDQPARIQRLLSDTQDRQAGQELTTRRYLVQLPADVPDIEVDHQVHVTACPNDPHLLGHALTVLDVQHGSERFTRDLTCQHNQAPRHDEQD